MFTGKGLGRGRGWAADLVLLIRNFALRSNNSNCKSCYLVSTMQYIKAYNKMRYITVQNSTLTSGS
jgi:hypothetical protein